MAFLVCYSQNPPDDHTRDKGIYLNQDFYEMIVARCIDADTGYPALGKLASIRYKSPITVIQNESIPVMMKELERLTASGEDNDQIDAFHAVCESAINRKCALTVSGDMYPELT